MVQTLEQSSNQGARICHSHNQVLPLVCPFQQRALPSSLKAQKGAGRYRNQYQLKNGFVLNQDQ